jgi:hypothetical protein
MSRFYFIHEEQEPYTRVSVETDCVTLEEVLREMECFLRGVGYHFDGKLEIVDWEPPRSVIEPSQDFLDHFENRN